MKGWGVKVVAFLGFKDLHYTSTVSTGYLQLCAPLYSLKLVQIEALENNAY